MGLFKRNASKPVTREQAQQILRRADVQEELRSAGIDPAVLEHELEHGQLRSIGGRTTIAIRTTMHVTEDSPPQRSDEDDPFPSGAL